MPVALLSVLMGCGDSIGSVEPPVLAEPPVSLTLPCEKPVLLPSQELKQHESETYWIADRSELISCGDEKAALIEFYRDRDYRITQ